MILCKHLKTYVISMLLFSLQVSSAFRLAKFQNSQSVQSLSHLFSLKAHSETLKKDENSVSCCSFSLFSSRTALLAMHSRHHFACIDVVQLSILHLLKRSLPTGVTPRTQLDKQIRRQQCKQWQPWDFEARCNFLLYSYNPGRHCPQRLQLFP